MKKGTNLSGRLIRVLVFSFLMQAGVCLAQFPQNYEISQQWQSGQAQGGWMLKPADPNIRDRIVLTGPSMIYDNSCRASLAMENPPVVSIDSSQKTIQLGFVHAYLGSCVALYAPLYAEITIKVGPLAAGQWRFVAPKGNVFQMPLFPTYEISFYVGPYSGGDGSAENPWQISSKEDLLAMGSHSEHYSDHFVMTADVNLGGEVFDKALIACDPVHSDLYQFDGFDGTAFSGVFDGNGFKIIGLTIEDNNDDHSYLGLFGFIDGGQIKNLGFEDASIKGFYFAGILAGKSSGNISNCYGIGQVHSSSDNAGGLVGDNSGNISHCYSMGEVSDFNHHLSLMYRNCYGGLAGKNSGNICDCYSSCNVSNIGFSTGGLVGYCASGGTISNCYSTGIVSGGLDTGGLAGLNSGSIINSYSTSSVIFGGDAGGLVGRNGGNISNCYSVGSVKVDDNCGGFAGLNESGSIIENCFWNIETQTGGITDGINYNDGSVTNIQALTTAQMQQKSIYTTSPAAWDFVNVWGIGENQSYPYLRQYPASDINQDRKVDYRDLAQLAENWLGGI